MGMLAKVVKIALSCLPAALAVVVGTSPAKAVEGSAIMTIQNIMTGFTSIGGDQLWIRVSGQPTGVPAACVWGPYSYFYVKSGGDVDPQKALAIFLTSKSTNQPVEVAWDTSGAISNFGGYGQTSCMIRKILW